LAAWKVPPEAEPYDQDEADGVIVAVLVVTIRSPPWCRRPRTRSAAADGATGLIRPPHVLLEHDNDTRVELSTVLVTDAIHRAHVADPHAVVGVADVGRRLDVAASTASRLVDRAVTAGMIGRGIDPADSRRAILTVTPAGAALLTRAMHFRCGYLKRVLTGWTPPKSTHSPR
jgi:DNA-binding MarR family transcriptional regulator